MYRVSLTAQALLCLLILNACSRGFEQAYADDGMPLFDPHSFANLRLESAFHPETRVTEKAHGCAITMVSTETPKHTFTTRYEVCKDKPKVHALVHMRDKTTAAVKEVFDLTSDPDPHFEHSLRFADIDGDGTSEMVALSCVGASKLEGCRKSWLYRLSEEMGFVNFFAAEYQRLWINDHYIVTESESPVLGLPKTIDEVDQSGSATHALQITDRSYQVYLRNPPKKLTGYDILDKHNENTVTWSHGLLFYTETDRTTGTCQAWFKSQSSGEYRPMHPIPETVQRFCTTPPPNAVVHQ
jgi:hypothetical protein